MPPSPAAGRRASRRSSGRAGAARAAAARRDTRSLAKLQRGAKLQPCGRLNSDGTMPLISFSRVAGAPLLRRGVEVRDRAQQALGVGMARTVEQLGGVRLLDLAAGIHHHDAVGVLGDHAHVVGDQDDGGAEGLLQLAHQVEDLRLDGDVERRGRLVGDQQLGIARRAPWRSSRAGACRRRAGADRRARAAPARGCGRGAASRRRGPSASRLRDSPWCSATASAICSPDRVAAG